MSLLNRCGGFCGGPCRMLFFLYNQVVISVNSKAWNDICYLAICTGVMKIAWDMGLNVKKQEAFHGMTSYVFKTRLTFDTFLVLYNHVFFY